MKILSLKELEKQIVQARDIMDMIIVSLSDGEILIADIPAKEKKSRKKYVRKMKKTIQIEPEAPKRTRKAKLPEMYAGEENK